MYQHSVVETVYGETGQVSQTRSFQGDSQIALDVPIAASTTHYEILCAIDVSLLKSLVIKSNRQVTLKTNSSGSPTDTITIKANVPYRWDTDSYNTCLITADTTKIFVTTPSGDPTQFQLLALVDA